MEGDYESIINLDGIDVNLRLWMISDSELKIEVIDETKYRRWTSTYKSNYLDSVARKSGLKNASVLWKMLQVGIQKKSKEVTLDLKNEDDFNSVIKESKGGLVLIIRYSNQFDNTNIPIIITSNPFQSSDLISIIKTLKREKKTDNSKEVKLLERQIFELNQTFALEKKTYLDQIKDLEIENKLLKEEIKEKNNILKNNKSFRAPSPINIRKQSQPLKSQSLIERQKQADIRRSLNSQIPNRKTPITNRFSAQISSQSSSRNSAINSRKNSAINSRNNSSQSSGKNTPKGSRCSSRNSDFRPEKRFDPTEWNRQRLINRKNLPSPTNNKKTYY